MFKLLPRAFNSYHLKAAFSASKQNLVQSDTDEAGYLAMNKLNFSEFLEYFCRVAHLGFNDTEMECLPLSEKIGHLMNEVFGEWLGGERRRFVNVRVDAPTDSDRSDCEEGQSDELLPPSDDDEPVE